MKFLTTFALTLCFAAVASAQTTTTTTTATTTTSTADAASALGTWNATFTTQNGQIPANIKLEKSGEKIVGLISSQMGESKLEAEVKGKTVVIWFTMQGQNGPLPIELNGTVDGDTFKGTASASGTAAGEFVATREKPTGAKADTTTTASSATTSTTSTTSVAPVNLTGNWNVSVELPNMTASPTITLKQDGEKLTGEYLSAQYGKFPITGTVKGGDISFWFGMNVEGNALNVTYTAKVDKDGKMTGTVNYGDMMNGTFTATKK